MKPVSAQSSAELQKRREALTREIELLNKSLKTTSSDKSLSLKQVNALNAQIRLRQQKINTINSQINLINNQINKNSKTIKELQDQLVQLKKDYASMVQFAYRNSNAYNKLMFVFASQDFNQAYKRLKYLQQFSESRKKQAEEIEKTQKDLQQKLAELHNNKKEQAALLTDQEKEKLDLDKQKGVKSKALNDLSQKEKQYKQELSKKQQEDARLARAIQAAIKREIDAERKREEARRLAAAKSSGEKPSASEAASARKMSDSEALLANPESAKLAADFVSNKGKLPWPVAQSSILQGFGQYTYGANVKVNSDGIKLRTPAGASVRAVFDGVVFTVVQIQNRYAVAIKHGNYISVYNNLKSVSVTKNQKVATKEAIGTVAIDAVEGTSDLEFQILQNATPINPSPWLARN
ncbi:murein hydrolase activator EnvC family protein [Olivibacter sitiensis]|uniref:murein hydrolase activator EnvC family protein n=1 Tax=Olivibacter sitiensis TaxID=376470 RepID=UPI000428F7DE|nr:peptidoglycan DD-metalloendopeptidase family protein [Olivibacter sitiensis]